MLLPEVELADTFCDGSPPFLKKRKEFPSSNVFLLAANLYLQAKYSLYHSIIHQNPPLSHSFHHILHQLRMDHKGHQIHSLDICNRLYNLVTKIVSAQAFKTVKLGHPVHQNLAKTQNGAIHEGDHEVHPRTTDQGEEPGCEEVEQEDSLKNWDAFASSCSSSNDREQEEAPLPCSLVAQAKPAKIKKMVSINDRVEEIGTRKKMKRSWKSTEKLPSIDLEEDIVQPVKSILKKDSFEHCDLAEKSIFFIHCDSI